MRLEERCAITCNEGIQAMSRDQRMIVDSIQNNTLTTIHNIQTSLLQFASLISTEKHINQSIYVCRMTFHLVSKTLRFSFHPFYFSFTSVCPSKLSLRHVLNAICQKHVRSDSFQMGLLCKSFF